MSTGGLGPTPDDLTREAIAAACGVETRVDEGLLTEIEALFTRRGMPMPEANRKQAWLIDGATALPNGHGSAPGWWVERPDGRIVIALPGPPREMWPMWREQALPRLQAGPLGVDRATHTLRLTGVGESALVGLIGEDVLRAANPQVATYARADAVDVVVSAETDGRSAAQALVDHAVGRLREQVGELRLRGGRPDVGRRRSRHALASGRWRRSSSAPSGQPARPARRRAVPAFRRARAPTRTERRPRLGRPGAIRRSACARWALPTSASRCSCARRRTSHARSRDRYRGRRGGDAARRVPGRRGGPPSRRARLRSRAVAVAAVGEPAPS